MSATTLTASAELLERVERALESVRGYLRTDGGDLRVRGITDEQVVEIELLGACSACSMSEMTMKAGVEQAVLRSVPEIKAVRTVVA